MGGVTTNNDICISLFEILSLYCQTLADIAHCRPASGGERGEGVPSWGRDGAHPGISSLLSLQLFMGTSRFFCLTVTLQLSLAH